MEWFSTSLSVAGKLASWFSDLLRKRRFAAKIHLSFGWDHPLIFVGGDSYTVHRVIFIAVTASQDAEFIVAAGSFEARQIGERAFMPVVDLAELTRLPHQVPANRQEQFWVAGSALAQHLRNNVADVPVFELRLIVRDYHNQRIISDPLQVSLDELNRTEIR